MADIPKIKRNIQRMIDANAPEEDIDAYVESEGITVDDLRAPNKEPRGYLPEAEPGFLKKTGQDLVKRGKQFVEDTRQPISGQSMLRQAGDVAGAFNDVVGNAVSSLYQTLVPESAQEVVSGAAGAVAGSAPVQWSVEQWRKFEEANPEGARNIRSATNIATAVPVGKIASIGTKKVVGATGTGLKNTAERELQNVVKTGMQKGIKGKSKNLADDEYYQASTRSVRNIVLNKENLPDKSLPQTVSQMNDAIGVTKKQIWEKVRGMSTEAGDQGVTHSFDRTIRELEDFANTPRVLAEKPEVAAYALKRAEDLKKVGGLSPVEAEEMISGINTKVSKFYSTTDFNAQQNLLVEKLIADSMRTEQHSLINRFVGPGYEDLKKDYGALLRIQDDVAHRTGVVARQNEKGFFDLSDVFTGTTAVHALFSLNPKLLLAAASGYGIKRYYKYLNSPNRYVKNMFKDSERIIAKEGKPTPKPTPSKTPPKQPPKSSPMPSDYNIEGTPVGNLGSGGLSLNKSSAPPPTTYGPLSDSYRKAGYSPATTTDEYIGNPSLPYNAPVYPQAGEPELLGDVGSIISALTRNKVRW
jgi:hypothetical protein